MTLTNRVGTAVVAIVMLGAAVIFYRGISGGFLPGQVAVSDTVVVDPAGGAPPVAIGSVIVGPAGLAIPVSGVKPEGLVDTFTQARAGGARVHDAIDIMAAEG